MAEVFRKCTAYKDLTAGSPREREFLHWLLTFLDTPSVWFHLSPVEVMAWEEAETRLEVGDVALPGLALPYSRPASVEGRLVPVDGEVEGNIAVAKFPEDVDDAKYLVLEAARRGAQAVLFTGRPQRRIAISGEPGFKLDSAPAPIPAASFEDLQGHIGKRARLVIDVNMQTTYSYNLVAFNSLDNTPMISAHWDHWLVGAADNCAGVEAAVLAFSELVADDVPIALGLFTAEEGVAPHLPSFYWAWGSLNYFKRWQPTLLVNIDVVGAGTPRIYAMPYLHRYLTGLGPVEDPIPYFDSVHLERWGLPSVTISSLRDAWGIYHSPLDAYAEPESILYAADLAKRIAKIKPTPPEVSLHEYGIPHVYSPYEAWSIVYNYLVLFRDFTHSDIVYTNVFKFLRSGAGYRRIDLLGGPTLCVEDCKNAVEIYRELVLLRLL
ncbi:putative aminopeptidase, Iap family [Pyrobaculum oguniense TE7]|uniref:Aminopeptidase, Iap family n=1 Tax=Pyrobaculum oguniense (strain DSM 13380 / JCM 10595 / TE7) TaxID=698757 RepID=H6QD66_PYROT|nr:putative aminopeptidase, Iap family [Pyrobaculum oguniense TE7]